MMVNGRIMTNMAKVANMMRTGIILLDSIRKTRSGEFSTK